MVRHIQDIEYKGYQLSLYQCLSDHGILLDMYEICVRLGNGMDSECDDWKGVIFKNDWMITPYEAIELGQAFVEGVLWSNKQWAEQEGY